jgi:hypothetical protein
MGGLRLAVIEGRKGHKGQKQSPDREGGRAITVVALSKSTIRVENKLKFWKLQNFCFIFAAPILAFAGVPNLVLVSVLHL